MLITKDNFSTLRKDIDAALTAVASKHNVRISSSRGHYSHDGLTGDLKLEFVGTGATTAGAPIDTKAAILFKKNCELYGLKATDLGRTFSSGRDTFKITGLNPKRWKMPIDATRLSDGKGFKFSEKAIPFATKVTPLFGSAPVTPAPSFGTCSEENAWDIKNVKAIGKCTKPATTYRKVGFGRDAERKPFCDDCAHLRDEARNEMEAEARANR
jgi:hypothetical protein